MKDGYKERIEQVEKTADYKESRKMWNYGIGMVLAGQAIRHFKDASGGYLFPEIARHHMSNLADAWMFAALLDYSQIIVSAACNKPAKSRPMSCATAAFIAGTLWEAFNAQLPNRKFDWGDESLHAASAIAFVLAKKHGKKSRTPQEPSPL